MIKVNRQLEKQLLKNIKIYFKWNKIKYFSIEILKDLLVKYLVDYNKQNNKRNNKQIIKISMRLIKK